MIDAYEVADKTGMGGRINTIMQTCFFAISGVLPQDEAIAAIKKAIKKTYGKRGEKVVQQNYAAVDQTLAHLLRGAGSRSGHQHARAAALVPSQAPEFVQKVTAAIIAGRGDDLPVSRLPVDGTYPTGTTQWEKRNIALEIPVWDPEVCIQCGKCALVCPHAAIRTKAIRPRPIWPARPRASSPCPTRARSTPAGCTPSRSRPRTAPAVRPASTSARPRTSGSRGSRPSTWRRSRRSATASGRTATSSSASRTSTGATSILDTVKD